MNIKLQEYERDCLCLQQYNKETITTTNNVYIDLIKQFK